MRDEDTVARMAYRHCRDDLRRIVQAAGLNLTGPSRDRLRSLKQQAGTLEHTLRKHRGDYETYLYQATGRKVDFEQVSVEREQGGLQFNVIAKFIIQKDSDEPLASRFFIDIRVVPSDDEFSKGVSLTLNAGFTNAIGMKHTKFTQEDFDPSKLEQPSDVFSWIEYLEGEFLKARRLVRPFGNGETDMGTR